MLEHDLFFLNDKDDIFEDEIRIKSSEAHHIQRVLRKKIADRIYLSDGEDYFYLVEISAFEASSIACTILKKKQIKTARRKLILYPALLKGSSFDLLIEKAIELAVFEIQPIITDHVIAVKNKGEKWRKIALKAQKQSKQVRHVKINEAVDLQQLKKDKGLWLVPEITEENQKIEHIVFPEGKEIHIFIGPEGGFSQKEIEFFREENADFLDLGELRLRAETAAWKTLSLLTPQ